MNDPMHERNPVSSPEAWLRQRLGLLPDAPDEMLLAALRRRHATGPDAVTEAYLSAQWLQRHGHEREAQTAYRQVCKLAGRRYHKRMHTLLEPLGRKERSLRVGIVAWLGGIAFFLLAIGLFFVHYKGPASAVEHAAPLRAEDSAFVTWLAQLQLRQFSELTGQEPSDEINLPQDTRPLTLQEQLLAMLGRSTPSQAGKGNAEPGTGGEGNGNGEGEGAKPSSADGTPGGNSVKGSFQCSREPLYCDPLDIPQAPGPYRAELRDAQLIAAETYLYRRDCAGLARMIDEHKAKGWRASERELKSSLEMTAQDCHLLAGDLDQARLHARRALCAGDERLASAYLSLHTLELKAGHPDRAETGLVCAKEACYYLLATYGPGTQLAENFRAVGAYYWMTLADAKTSVTMTEKAGDLIREMIRTGDYDSPYVFQKEIGIDLDLLEVYLTHGGLEERFERTYRRLIDNPRLDGDRRVIALSLKLCRLLITRRYAQAEPVLAELIRRYEHLPELSVGWSWSGFERWVNEHPDRLEDDTASWMHKLFESLSGDVEAPKLATLRAMAHWLREKR